MSAYRVKIVDNCSLIAQEDSYLYRTLKNQFPIELSDSPDFVFYSVFGYEHVRPRYDRAVKIFFVGENIRPDFSKCDYALSFDYLDNEPRHLRLPLYLHYFQTGELLKGTEYDPRSLLCSKSRFCNFVYSNAAARTRIEFFHKLSRYKQVDSGGQVLNNIGHRVDDKMSFLRSYKFTIAFENASYPGYTTEKIVEPMLAGSIPIYWGNPLIGREFNTRSFINCHDYASFEDVIDEVKRLDKDDEAYAVKLAEPWLPGNQDNEYTRADHLRLFYERVFRTPPYSYPKWAGIIPRDFGLGIVKEDSLVTGPQEPRVFQ